MKILQKSSFWWFCFTLIFLLSLDFWSWHQEIELTWLQLPFWVFYFITLQLLLALGMFVFAQKFWKTSVDKETQG